MRNVFLIIILLLLIYYCTTRSRVKLVENLLGGNPKMCFGILTPVSCTWGPSLPTMPPGPPVPGIGKDTPLNTNPISETHWEWDGPPPGRPP